MPGAWLTLAPFAANRACLEGVGIVDARRKDSAEMGIGKGELSEISVILSGVRSTQSKDLPDVGRYHRIGHVPRSWHGLLIPKRPLGNALARETPVSPGTNPAYRRSLFLATLFLLVLCCLPCALRADALSSAVATQAAPPTTDPASPPAATGPQLPARADLEQKLGATLPLDLPFTDETGHTVPLGSFFNHGRPVILQLGYNHCWLMCDVVTGALVRSMQDIRLDPGQDFDVLFVSIDPNETWQFAAEKRAVYIRTYGRLKTGPGWHFLTGTAPSIHALADAVGFHYFYDAENRQFAHPSGLMIVIPTGIVSKYFYGVEYDPHALRSAILQATGNTVGSRVQAILLLCYHWNPLAGKYGVLISRVLKTLCLGTVAVLGGFILYWLRRESRHPHLPDVPG